MSIICILYEILINYGNTYPFNPVTLLMPFRKYTFILGGEYARRGKGVVRDRDFDTGEKIICLQYFK